jgi:hypothetical protein
MDVDTVGEALTNLWKGRRSFRDEAAIIWRQWRTLAAEQKAHTADLVHFWTVTMREEDDG